MQTDHTQLLDTHLKIIQCTNAKEYDYTKDVVDLDALAITDEAKHTSETHKILYLKKYTNDHQLIREF